MNNEQYIDRHHAFFNRKDYGHRTMAWLLRSHNVNILPAVRKNHNTLHAQIGSLAVISDTLARDVLEYLNSLPDTHTAHVERLPHFIGEINHLDYLSRTKGLILAKEASYFATALEAQLPYLGASYE